MGKTQQLGTLVDALFTDSSNNVGIGAAANASYKLQVTGTTNLTGALSGTSITLTNALTALTLYSNAGLGLSLSGQFTGGGGYTGINGQALGIDIRPNSGGIFNLNFSSTTNRTFTFPDDSGTLVLGVGTTNYLPKFTGTSAIGNSLVYDNGTNVGIGTASPSQKLEVAGVIRGEAINVYGSTDPASTSPYLYSPSLGALGFGGNGSIKMTMTSGGNLLVGTTTDAGYKLDVNGTGRFTNNLTLNSSSSIGVIAQTTANSVYPYFRWVAANRSYWAAAIDNGTDATWQLGNGNTIGSNSILTISAANNSATFSSSVTANGVVSAAGYAITSGDAISASGNLILNTGADRYVQIGSSTNYYWRLKSVGDNFRINGGADAFTAVEFAYPTGAATFSSSVTAATESNFLGTSVNSRILVTASGVANTVLGFNNSGSTVTGVSNNCGYIGVLQAYPLVFTTNSTERMRITSSGNVGIGTTSPGDLLQLGSSSTRGTMSIFGTSSGVPVLQLNNTNASGGNAWNLYAGLSAAGSFNIYDNNATLTRFTITNSGNVGIGTSSPSQLLDIVGTTPMINIQAGANTNARGIQFNYNGSTIIGSLINYGATGENALSAGSSGTSGYFLTFKTDGSERMRITSAGNVLINKTSARGNEYLGIESGGNEFCNFQSTGGVRAFRVNNVDVEGFNTAGTAIFVGKLNSTGRSINAGGTINALGTDYAEYMTKSTNDIIEKGDIVGIDSNGLLTNIYNNSISFAVKSTNPSYVGGDVWGAEIDDKIELEIARQKVDRIAFSGQVPCNVYNAKVGDYIIPIELNGKISGQAVTNPTFEQYQISVGKVWKIMDDGRAWIAVKIG